ncbi:MAG: helix-hairpin-helix domain-containing protein [Planctomycetota bacterium]|nr:helix-hairpin-helix domain-containing protein [Planctomycetaceae bacterium]MDQ3333352.1 helix-hairpin-helix domain-containing protein [Planctomycetota bacterium]
MAEAVEVAPSETKSESQPIGTQTALKPSGGEPAASRGTQPANEAASSGSWATCWLTDRDLLVFTMLAGVMLVLLVVRWAELSGWGTREIEIERLTPLPYNFRLDPNTATWVELAQLDGVGETLAVRIVEDREANGPFRTLDDLDRVKGIGAKTLDRLRPYLQIVRQYDVE